MALQRTFSHVFIFSGKNLADILPEMKAFFYVVLKMAQYRLFKLYDENNFLMYLDQSESYSKTLWGIERFNRGHCSNFRIFRKKNVQLLAVYVQEVVLNRKIAKSQYFA